MANFPIGSHIAGVTGASGPCTGITINAGSYCSSSNGGNLTIASGSLPIGVTGPYGPVEFRHDKTTIKICWNGILISGDVKEAAMALAKAIFDLSDGSIATSWEGVLKAHHGNGNFSLEYLLKDRPEFFNELNEQYERICKLKAFM